MAAKMERTRTPGIYKRGSRYVVVWTHRGRQHKQSYATYGEAREAKGQRAGGERRPASSIRVDDYFRDWITSYRGRTRRGLEESTRDRYRVLLERHVLPFMGRSRLRDVGPEDVRAWMGWLERQGATAATVRKARAPLSAMFATALEDGLVRTNPTLGVRYVPSPGHEDTTRKQRALTAGDVRLILGALPAEWQLFFEMLAHTGLRIGEALGLTWRDVELGDDPRIHVREQIYRGKRKKLKTEASTGTIPSPEGWPASSPACDPRARTSPAGPYSRRRPARR